MELSLLPPDSEPSILAVAAILATCGWVYTARRNHFLARKQHTINILLKANFDDSMRSAHLKLTPIFRGDIHFPTVGTEDYNNLLPELRFVLNHFEFVAAGIRRGDMDERLVLDAQRGTILTAYEKSEPHIFSVRSNRRNQAVYEHLEWLHKRWEKSPPGRIKCGWEKICGSPIYGKRNSVRD